MDITGLPRIPHYRPVDRIRDQPADLVRHRSPRFLDLKAQEQLLVPEQKSPQKLNLEPNTSAESAMNAALAQAEIKNGFMDMMKLLNDVLRPAESRPQPLQEGRIRQASMVPTPSCLEGGATEIHQGQETDSYEHVLVIVSRAFYKYIVVFNSRNSFFAPTKFVALSQSMPLATPLLPLNLLSAAKNA